VNESVLLEWLPSIGLAIGLAACAGLRAWLPLLLTGVLARAGYVEIGPSFAFIGSTKALVVFGVATLIEMIGDKIPSVDHALDAIGTVLRPAAGALLAASVLWKIEEPLLAVAIGVAVGAPSALVPHAAKSAFRMLSTTLTAGLANPIVSLLEDAIALGLFALAILLPLLAAIFVAFLAAVLVRRSRDRHTATPQPA